MDVVPESDFRDAKSFSTPRRGRYSLWWFWGVIVALVLTWRIFHVITLLLPVLVFGTLGWFLYHVWGRKLLRARHIANARERRLWREASRRR